MFYVPNPFVPKITGGFRLCSTQCHFRRCVQCPSTDISNTKQYTFRSSSFMWFRSIFTENIATYLTYDSHWWMYLNKSQLGPWTVLFSEETILFFGGRVRGIRMRPLCAIHTNTSYLLVTFSTDCSQHNVCSMMEAGMVQEVTCHSRWLSWQPQVNWLRTDRALLLSPGTLSVTPEAPGHTVKTNQW